MSNFVDRKTTTQVRLDKGWHRRLKMLSAKHLMSIKAIMEECLADSVPDFEERHGRGKNEHFRD